jgi:hypothetical protein
MKNLVKILFLLFALVGSNPAFGWGQTGHRVIGQIAENHLSRKAKKNIEKILGDESLAIVSIWMDEVRSDRAYDHTHDWHWVSIPDNSTYDACEKNSDGDVIEAIGRMKEILMADDASLEKKKEALKFMVHLVGDLHQPLHVGNGMDKGGNDVKIKWFYKSSNLHRIWDSGIIDKKGLSYTELATSIDHATKEEISDWQKGNPKDWAQECMGLRSQVYAIGEKDNLSYQYMYKNWGLVQDQLEKAGVRLAGLLNEIFG